MPDKTSHKSENPVNDIDRHCCWLFVACKMGQANEDTLEFVLSPALQSEIRTCPRTTQERLDTGESLYRAESLHEAFVVAR